jgi:hypothetical protein
MTPKISFIITIVGVALVLAAPAFGDAWGADQNHATVRVSPDLADRVAAARQQELTSMLDARERSVAAKSVAMTVTTSDPVRDDRFRLDPSSIATPAATISTARDVEWLQIGMGFGGGILLALGLFLAMRMTRVRQAAH